MKHSLEEDRQLLSKIFSGDRKASEILVRQFSGLVYKSIQAAFLIRQVTFNHQDIEDMHNTVFLQFFEQDFKKLRQYRGENGCSLASWIKLVTGRIALNYIRKKDLYSPAQRKMLSPPDVLPELMGDEKGPIAEMEETEQHRLLQDGINSLQPRDALFIKLHLEKGLSIEEVAESLQLSMQNAYIIKHRVIKKLKTFLDTAKNN